MYPGRTTPSLVEKIFALDPAIMDITPFIDTANELVTECCSWYEFSDGRLELIERWLTAHFLSMLDPRTTREQAGPAAQDTFESKIDTGTGLRATRYGQQAILLDSSGSLAALDNTANQKDFRLPAPIQKKKHIVGALWLGDRVGRIDRTTRDALPSPPSVPKYNEEET